MTPADVVFWRPQSRRRLAVVLLYAGYLVVALAAVLTSRAVIPHTPGIAITFLVGVGALMGLVGVVHSRTSFFGSGELLDERQRSVRDRAYLVAYHILGLVAAGGAVLLGFSHLAGTSLLTASRGEVVLLVLFVVLLVLSLPSAMMAWMEPDPPEDSGAHGMINRRTL